MDINRLRKIADNKHFKYGAPFLIAMVGGSFALQHYSQLRYDVQKERRIMTKIKPKRQVTLEEEYQEYKKTVDLENWQNIRGPRPWESDNEDYKQVIEKRAREAKSQWTFGH